MPDVDMSTLNLVFAALSVICAGLSIVMFVLARRAARAEIEPRPARAAGGGALPPEVVEPAPAVRIVGAERSSNAGLDLFAADDDSGDPDVEEQDVQAHVAPAPPVVDERDDEPAAPRSKLPKGAEAALWSITETVPNPRNHIVLKDPTSEVRVAAPEAAEQPSAEGTTLTEARPRRRDDLGRGPAPADETPAGEAPTGETPTGDDPAGDTTPDDGQPSLREGRVRGAIDDTEAFTGEYFFAGEPRLNRF